MSFGGPRYEHDRSSEQRQTANRPRRKPGASLVPAEPASIIEPADDAFITSLKSTGGENERVAVYVNKKRVATISTNEMVRLGLAEGTPWDTKLCDAVTHAAQVLGAVRHAVRLLRARDRSGGDLARRLRIPGHDPAAIAKAVDLLRERGLVDDARFAESTARSIARRGDVGRRAIESKLMAKGVDREQARAAARDETEGVDERERATDAARARARRMTSLDRETKERRLLGFLARRGFDHGDCREAVRTVLNEEPDHALE